MNTLKSWTALINREYLEHRMSFVYFPVGILVLLALSAASALIFNRGPIDIPLDAGTPSMLKLFELGYLILAALWLAYLSIALFFYFGDSFSADRRNNAMFFWKSMPVSDLKILASKFLAGVLLFPLILFAVTLVSGLLHFLIINVAPFIVPGLLIPDAATLLISFANVSLFVIVHVALSLLWFAPFLAWVGGLSAVFGRWSLVLSFLIPGLVVVVENIVAFGHIPRGGYVWSYLSQRFEFGLHESDYMAIVVRMGGFSGPQFIGRLWRSVDWVDMGTGLVFAALVVWLASEYRRRRIV
jgi:ABC-2 type transport system permease protein